MGLGARAAHQARRAERPGLERPRRDALGGPGRRQLLRRRGFRFGRDRGVLLMPFFVSRAFIAILGRVADDAREEAATARARAERAERDAAALAATNRTLERQNAVSQANQEWLRMQVNLLTDERARLMERDLSFSPTRSEIVGMPSAATTTPGATREDERRRRADEVIADATTGAGMFEDMGDEAAAELGITSAPDGSVVYPH